MKSPVPKWLDDEGKAAWHRWKKKIHADTDADTFAMLCDLWSVWRKTKPEEKNGMIRYIALAKQIQSFQKQLGMYPDIKSKPKQEENEDDEFRDL